MEISANHLKRYKEIALVLWKYGRSDLVRQMGIDEVVDPREAKTASDGAAKPEQLADDLEAMGPTYVKLGQVLSGRPDLLPDAYLKALARLQDKVKPFAYAQVEQNVGELMAQRLRKSATPGNLFSSLLEMKDFVGGLPSRLNQVMDAITNHELEVKIKAVDARLIMEGFQKIANRITAGIVLASLIVGASLLMQVETSFRILGYPGLAMLCFLVAAVGGFWLVFNIFAQDHHARKQ